MRTCDLPTCERRHLARGLCDRHYWNARQSGHPLGTMVAEALERGWVVLTDDAREAMRRAKCRE